MTIPQAEKEAVATVLHRNLAISRESAVMLATDALTAASQARSPAAAAAIEAGAKALMHADPYAKKHWAIETATTVLAAPARSPAAGVMEGWKLVPVEPTPEMAKAGYEAMCGGLERGEVQSVEDNYRTMLAAAPPSPLPAATVGEDIITRINRCADTAFAALHGGVDETQAHSAINNELRDIIDLLSTKSLPAQSPIPQPELLPARLLAIRDALIECDTNEAYHQLRMIVDPGATIAWNDPNSNHWINLEVAAAKCGPIDRVPPAPAQSPASSIPAQTAEGDLVERINKLLNTAEAHLDASEESRLSHANGLELYENLIYARDEIRRLNKWADGFSDAQLKERSLCEAVIKEKDTELRRLHSAHANMVKALRYARPLVEKWCHYQGNNKQFFADTLAPIDAALSTAQAKPIAKDTGK